MKIMLVDSVGRTLKERREEYQWSIEAASERCGVSCRSIMELEEGGCEVSVDAFRREFLHRYARALVLPCDDLWKQFQEEKKLCGVQPRFEFRELPAVPGILGPRAWRTMMGAMAISASVLYVFFAFRNAMAAPLLEVESPLDGLVSSNRVVMVQGKASDQSAIFINGARVVPQSDGTFEVPLALNEGLNTITIDAVRKKNRTSTITRHVLVELQQ